MDEVFILRHANEFEDGHEDVKIIGIYRTRADAQAVLVWIKEGPGFRDHLDGFAIEPYVLNRTEWRDGYVTGYPHGAFSN
jgi:hypothetical protein